jgi:hypothetical protein
VERWNFLIVPLFMLAAAACGITAGISQHYRRGQGSRDPKMWLMFAVIFLAFVAIKAQRIVEMLENAARNEAQVGGMYDQRHPYQVAVVVGATLLGLAQGLYFSGYIAQRWRRYWLPLVGTGTVICFGIVRAVSLHELDALGPWVQTGKGIVESLAAVMAMAGAMMRVRHLRATEQEKADRGVCR